MTNEPCQFTGSLLTSSFASAGQADRPEFVGWLEELGFEDRPVTRHNRKVWEWCFVLEAMQQSGLMAPGRSALGFGVGHERLPAILASRGMRVVATDQAADSAGDWALTNQHATALSELRYDEVCPQERFERLVSFRSVDMNDVPADLVGFDLIWSSCAFEHLGSPSHGTAFVLETARRLTPGGIAVHTTEVRVDGGSDVELSDTVLYSVDSMLRLLRELSRAGCDVAADFTVPLEHEHDRFVDEHPYAFDPAHLKLRIGDAVTTSFGLVLRRSTTPHAAPTKQPPQGMSSRARRLAARVPVRVVRVRP